MWLINKKIYQNVFAKLIRRYDFICLIVTGLILFIMSLSFSIYNVLFGNFEVINMQIKCILFFQFLLIYTILISNSKND